MSKLFLLLKPEVRNHLQDLDEFLVRENFDISSRHPISDWGGLSRKLYAPQLASSDAFRYEFGAYTWLSQHLFGNNSAVFILDSELSDLQQQLYHLKEIRNRFRQYLDDKGAGAIQIFLNMEKLNTEGAQALGERGILSVGDRFLSDPKFIGRWEDFYFKYIHTPDPTVNDLQREIEVLGNEGVFDKTISEKEWRLMKSLQTLVFPDIYQGGEKSK